MHQYIPNPKARAAKDRVVKPGCRDVTDEQYLAHWKTRCIINPVTGCWEFQGQCQPFRVGKPPYPKGYAISGYRGKQGRLARIIAGWKLGRPLVGRKEVPRHLCNVPFCICPDHITPGTQTENIQDYVKAGRQRFGKRTACSRGHEFTPETCRITTQIKNGKEYTVRVCKVCMLGFLRVRHGWPEALAFSLPPQVRGYRPPEVTQHALTEQV